MRRLSATVIVVFVALVGAGLLAGATDRGDVVSVDPASGDARAGDAFDVIDPGSGDVPAEPQRLAEVQAQIERQVVAYINAERAAAGVGPVAVWADNTLAGVASDDLIETDIAHRIFRELTPSYREFGAGRIGEIQYRGRSMSPSRAVLGWRGSLDHNRIMLDAEFTHVNVAARCTEAGRDNSTVHLLVAPDQPTDDRPTAATTVDRDTVSTVACANAFLPTEPASDGQ